MCNCFSLNRKNERLYYWNANIVSDGQLFSIYTLIHTLTLLQY